MTNVPAKIFYLDETCDNCDPWLRETRESPWRRVRDIRASKGDRVVIKDVEHVVEEDGSRRRLKRGEKHLWKTWDIPALGFVPDPIVIETSDITEPIQCHGMKTLKKIGDRA